MSKIFSDTSAYNGLVQLYEREIGANRGDISSDTTKLKQFTADVNSALDYFPELAIKSSGTWQWDDSNQTDYPIIKSNIVSGQRDYAFTSDSSSNLILDIYKLAILPSATATLYEEIYPVDVQSGEDYNLLAEVTTTGIPGAYDKTANAIFFDIKPSYDATNGIKMYINREASYFTYLDTTKKPGVPGIFHEYFFLKPAMDYARRNTLANHDKIALEVSKLEQNIKDYYGRREKDVDNELTMRRIFFR